jgi:hypothetical protein
MKLWGVKKRDEDNAFKGKISVISLAILAYTFTKTNR